MANTSLGLIVLRSADMERSLAFYRVLGLEFIQEQHGTGPVHYACELNGLVLELYPGTPRGVTDRRQAGATMIGFRVSELTHILDTLKANGAEIISEPKGSMGNRRAVIQDPDGRAVELNEVE